jgi:hypothetical protein
MKIAEMIADSLSILHGWTLSIFSGVGYETIEGRY